jgi:hypothetical protein
MYQQFGASYAGGRDRLSDEDLHALIAKYSA